ncbi:hypothetical protein [Tritonibacter aquimaris]|uniref:hypothetical protein n=1 Tax=Tritonibacter aquimaris TaxID=2663379 RepID=UPI001885E1E3|nr:hypothetical protein [Tritonibacter aquimaris]
MSSLQIAKARTAGIDAPGNTEGNLAPPQNSKRDVSSARCPINKSLNSDGIMSLRSDGFIRWDYRQGHYY